MSQSSRSVVVHYHIFKNAGSSVDQLLKKNFGDKWVGFDGEKPGSVITTQELEKIIGNKQDKIAFSSHQIVPPLPSVDAEVYPVVFLRDPIDRIKSAYLFEWKKQLGLDEPKGSFEEFVSDKFTHKRKSSVEEFQTIRLSNANTESFQSGIISDEGMLGNACEFVSKLGFIGIVDDFDRSNQLLAVYLGKAFPDFELSEFKANVLQDISISQSVKRQRIKDELGDELFEMIVSRNAMDEALYQHGKRHLEKLCQLQWPSTNSNAQAG